MAVPRRVSSGIVLLALVAALNWPLPWLVVEHHGHWRLALPALTDTRFAVRWQHSVELEDWIEYYRLHDGVIRVMATRFKTFGAGVPAHAGRSTRLVDGWVEMDGIDRVVDPLNIQAAAAEHHRLLHDGHVWPLYSSGPPQIVTLAARRAPLWRVLPVLIRTWRLGTDDVSGRTARVDDHVDIR